MPQLDPSVFAPQLIWLLISFVALYLIMIKVALPKVSETLENRRNQIDHDLEKAKTLNEEARAVLEDYEQSLAQARAESQKAFKEANDALAKEAAQRHAALGETLARQTKEAEQRIGQAKEQALDQLRSVAADVAQTATRKLVAVEANEAEVQAAVDAAMKERS